MVEWDKYYHVTAFLYAALFLREDRAHVFVSKTEVLYLQNFVRKEADVV